MTDNRQPKTENFTTMPNTSDERMKNALADWTAKNNVKSKESLAAPSADSNIKVEHYELPLVQSITLGTPLAELPDLSTTPQTEFKPVKLICNSPARLFVIIRDILFSNCPTKLLHEPIDSFTSCEKNAAIVLHVPELAADDTISISAVYTGFVPNGFDVGKVVQFVATFVGEHTFSIFD